MEEAVTLLDSAYKYDPNNFGVWFPLGLAYYRVQKYEESAPFMKKAMDFARNENETVSATMYYGICHYYMGKYDEALQILTDAELKYANSDKQPLIKAYIGLTYKSIENYQKAVEYLQNAINAYPMLAGELNFCINKLR